MNSLVMDGEEYDLIWETVNKLQIIFHPRVSNDGIINYKQFSELKRNTQVVLLLDRNLLSGLLNLARNGSLKEKKEMQLIGLIMTWISMNNVSANAGLALLEYGTNIKSNIEPKKELKEFNNIFEFYPVMIWLRLAQGKLNEIPICPLPADPFMTSSNYHEEDEQSVEANLREAYVKFIQREDLRLLIFDKETKKFIGSSGLHNPEWELRKFEIGYWIDTRMSGKGYMTEAVLGITNFAFTALEARRIEIRCDTLNYKSKAIPERLGYQLEGTLRCDSLSVDRSSVRDTHIYAQVK